MAAQKNSTASRELSITKTFNAPVEWVWEMWADPEHIAQWWGPNGFTTTVHQMDFKEGGEWLLTMHGPDGKHYPNKAVFKEIVPLKKIMFEHFNPDFVTTVNFEAKGKTTLMRWTMVFENPEMLEIVVKAHKADEGLKQNAEKLEKYLSPYNH